MYIYTYIYNVKEIFKFLYDKGHYKQVRTLYTRENVHNIYNRKIFLFDRIKGMV